jgi:uncharacterized protein YeaO (DUF488 family)
MKPLSLNLSKMKKIAGDKHSSTFLHPSGHKMVIAHGGVSALQRKQLEQMPVHQFAEGGSASDWAPENLKSFSTPPKPGEPWQDGDGGYRPDPELIAQNSANRAPASFASDAGAAIRQGVSDAAGAFKTVFSPIANGAKEFVNGLTGPDANAVPVKEESRAPQSEPSSSMSAGHPQSPDLSASNIPIANTTDFPAAYKQGQQAITEQQKIDSAKAKADLDIQTQDLANKQQLSQQFQDHLKDFNTHQQQFMQDYMNNHIDPKHYVENMGAGSKIATAIGMLLGGASSSVTGHNPAADFLNKQIDRDIAAQQSRQDQQKTLIGANQALFHDNVMAMNQTRINMNDIYDRQIQAAANKLGTPQAKANADAAHAKFAMENQALLQQNAMRATVMNHLKAGGQGLNAIDLANAGIIPKEEAVKEQASLDAQKTAIAKTQELYHALNKEQTTGNLLNPQSSRRVDALNAELVNAVMNASASKRLTHESIQSEIAPLMIKTTDDQKTRQEKQQGLLNIIQRHADPTPYMSHYAPGSLPQYASSSPEIQTRNGVRYQKVPGGWKKLND